MTEEIVNVALNFPRSIEEVWAEVYCAADYASHEFLEEWADRHIERIRQEFLEGLRRSLWSTKRSYIAFSRGCYAPAFNCYMFDCAGLVVEKSPSVNRLYYRNELIYEKAHPDELMAWMKERVYRNESGL